MFNKFNVNLLILFSYLILSLYLIEQSLASSQILYGLAMASIINAARRPQFGGGYKQPYPQPLPYPMFLSAPPPPFYGRQSLEPPPKPKEVIVEQKKSSPKCDNKCQQTHHYHINEVYEVKHSAGPYGGHSHGRYGGGAYGHGGHEGGGYGGHEYGGHGGGGGGCKKCRSCHKKKKAVKYDIKSFDSYSGHEDGGFAGHEFEEYHRR